MGNNEYMLIAILLFFVLIFGMYISYVVFTSKHELRVLEIMENINSNKRLTPKYKENKIGDLTILEKRK